MFNYQVALVRSHKHNWISNTEMPFIEDDGMHQVEQVGLFVHTLALRCPWSVLATFVSTRCRIQCCDVRLDLFSNWLRKNIPDCCNHFAMACMTIQLTNSEISNRTKRIKVGSLD